MPSPARLYENYTDAELVTEKAALKLEMTNGTFTSLGGASKSSSIDRPSIQDRLKSLALEFRMRGTTTARAQQVQARFYDSDYSEGGTITE